MTPCTPVAIEVLAVDDRQERRPQPLVFDEFEEHDDEPTEGYHHTSHWDWDEDDDW